MKRMIFSTMILILSFFPLFTLSDSAAAAEPKRWSSADPYYAVSRESDVLDVLALLEKRVEDQCLLDRVRTKLSGLPESQFSLIASLSKEVLKEGSRARADIAFLLITVLIVLS